MKAIIKDGKTRVVIKTLGEDSKGFATKLSYYASTYETFIREVTMSLAYSGNPGSIRASIWELEDEDNKEIAKEKIKNNIPIIEENIKEIFEESNYNMNFNVNYGYNYFPEKEYRGLKYSEGYYESIVISIGKAEGDNWWCVLFPNLCIVDLEAKDNLEYKSWIIEKINKIF